MAKKVAVAQVVSCGNCLSTAKEVPMAVLLFNNFSLCCFTPATDLTLVYHMPIKPEPLNQGPMKLIGKLNLLYLFSKIFRSVDQLNWNE